MSYSYKKNKTLVFSEEIISELAKELDLDEKYITDIVDTNIKYVKKSIAENDNILIVSFPNLGKLVLNYYLGLSSKTVQNFNVEAKINLLQNIMKRTGKSLKNFRRPLIYKFGKKLRSDIFNDTHVIANFNKIWSDINIKYDEKINK
jgi:nucleoid DNA-binding protein